MKRALCWLRRDLRLEDHLALSKALEQADQTYLCFILDRSIIEKLKSEMKHFSLPLEDARLGFIWQALQEIHQTAKRHGSSLILKYGDPIELIPKICKEYDIEKVFFNRDYEPAAKKRDLEVISSLDDLNVEHQHFKDHVIFEHNQIRTKSDSIYKVFTPYKNQWREVFSKVKDDVMGPFKTSLSKLAKINLNLLEQNDWEKQTGVTFLKPSIPGTREWALNRLKEFSKKQLSHYQDHRDYPALEATSSLSASLRHGLISVREMLGVCIDQNGQGYQSWMDEVIWREFYQMILDTHPFVAQRSFKEQYDQIKWKGGEKEFSAWANGMTGFPLIDAAMRGLNQTGQIHNRLRMIVASFLCKTLLVDWRQGERYFALKLLDYDMAANNGGWQWSSSSGCDAQPYFRIFNPYTQSEKFDKQGEFIKLYCPELRELPSKAIHNPDKLPPLELREFGLTLGEDYPLPIVDYKKKREQALEMYSVVKSSK